MRGHSSHTRGEFAGATRNHGYGRYGSMLGLDPANRLSRDALIDIAEAMIRKDDGPAITECRWMDENPTIPAGYTYFGQFIAHDITFDPTPLTDAELDDNALIDFRAPALDLDSVYRRGPEDERYLYYGLAPGDERRLKLRMGSAVSSGGAPVGTKRDILRMTDKTWQFRDDRDDVAILGDPRNDENKLVSQIHGMVLEFHNKIIADDAVLNAFHADLSNDGTRFHAAAMLVRWHYQWLVIHDFLDRVCMPGTKDRVLNPGGTPRLQHYLRPGAAKGYVPVEFSGAAFRFGHSMVRPSYTVNRLIGVSGNRLPLFSHTTNNLGGFPGALLPDWGIDWGYFLDGVTANAPTGFNVPQPSFRIDALLADPLATLPEFKSDGAPDNSLPFRNLDRGQMLGLPSGQAAAQALGIAPLSDDILWDAGSKRLSLSKFNGKQRAAFSNTQRKRATVKKNWVDSNGGPLAGNTPLWYYILREAEYYGVEQLPNDPGIGMGGQHLGPVGSQIVAETLIGLLWHDRGSFLHSRRGFKPMPQITGKDDGFSLADLVRYALS